MYYLRFVFWHGDLTAEAFFPAVLEGSLEETAVTRQHAWECVESLLVFRLADLELDDFCETFAGC